MIGYKYEDGDIDIIKELFNNTQNVTTTAKEFCKLKSLHYEDASRKRVSNLLLRLGITISLNETQEIEKSIDDDYNFAKSRKLSTSKYYIVTWEQNATPLHGNLWKNILAYKEFLGAELSVILGRYKNPTSVFTDSDYDSWNELTKPYWDANRHDIHKYLTILGDVKIQPTAVDPLSSLEDITGETCTIVGHPKMWLKSVPVLEGHPKKILTTTGAITLPNYTDSKSGKKAEAKHKLGFVIIEVKDEEIFFIRQVEADSQGNFIDLVHNVKDGVVSKNDVVDAIVWGDTHVASLNPEILPETLSFIEKMNVPLEVHHDLLDGTSVNNHIINNPIEQYKRMIEQKDDVAIEIDNVLNFLEQRPETKKLVIQSNHNDRLDRWVINQDWKKDIKNSLTYLKYTTAALEGKAPKGILAYLIEDKFKTEDVICLDYDDSYLLHGIELAHHGHIGANGSRGNANQFRKMSTKMVLGHYHSPFRMDDVVGVGTSSHLREGYNKGASSWLNSHIIILPNGKTQHLIFVRGEFTTFKY